MLQAAKQVGIQTFYFEQPEPAGELVRTLAQPGDAILFKGSRGVRVEEALGAFLKTFDGGSR